MGTTRLGRFDNIRLREEKWNKALDQAGTWQRTMTTLLRK
jgi:hypothetical protein